MLVLGFFLTKICAINGDGSSKFALGFLLLLMKLGKRAAENQIVARDRDEAATVFILHVLPSNRCLNCVLVHYDNFFPTRFSDRWIRNARRSLLWTPGGSFSIET